MTDLTTAEMEAMIPEVMASIAASEARRAADEKRRSEQAAALEEITDSYRALTAVADLMILGGSIPGQHRPTLECVAADDMLALLRVIAGSIGRPLERAGFLSP